MSYVGDPFSHDLFVTYSHGDAAGDGRALLRQWSECFAKELRAELQAIPEIADQIRIFFDNEHRPHQGLDPTEPLSDALQREIASSAMLAVLMSPHYLSSSWCADERNWWIDAQKKHDLSAVGRLAVARIWPTDDYDWPDTITDSLGNELVGRYFYARETAQTRPQPYSWPAITSETTGPFREALLDFVGDTVRGLEKIKMEIKERQEREAERKRLAQPAGQVVYLHGRDTHYSQWDRVSDELEESGYTILPTGPEAVHPEPIDRFNSRNERISAMTGCDAILLLGTEDERALTADLAVVGRMERHEAISISNRTLPCGVVDTAGVVQRNPAWSNKASQLGIDWFDTTSPPWVPKVQAWLNEAVV